MARRRRRGEQNQLCIRLFRRREAKKTKKLREREGEDSLSCENLTYLSIKRRGERERERCVWAGESVLSDWSRPGLSTDRDWIY